MLSCYLGSTVEYYDFLLHATAASLVFPESGVAIAVPKGRAPAPNVVTGTGAPAVYAEG